MSSQWLLNDQIGQVSGPLSQCSECYQKQNTQFMLENHSLVLKTKIPWMKRWTIENNVVIEDSLRALNIKGKDWNTTDWTCNIPNINPTRRLQNSYLSTYSLRLFHNSIHVYVWLLKGPRHWCGQKIYSCIHSPFSFGQPSLWINIPPNYIIMKGRYYTYDLWPIAHYE